MPNNTTQQDIIFPDNSAEIITNILKKYALIESWQEFLTKIEQKKEPIDSMVADLLKKIAMQELPQKDMPSILKEKLNITAKKAKDLSADLEAQILSKVRPRERDITIALKKKAVKLEETKKQIEKQTEIIPEKKKSPIKDTYRESIEE